MNEETKKKLLEIIHDVGIITDSSSDNEDFDLSEYIQDSSQFISLVVDIENAFDIALPDEFLIIDKFRSIDAVVQMIEELVSNQ